ncbi:hypothetical protein [Bauldia litoralis]|uniref:Uncharacterized protein n=1 Tax=Bauldia litoralis TaxID=665467 RepID=A0A1G6EN82_9HYPH|nr:hypothetical protein [Bauldia litoralis]SDB58834.1 hypothetical protein SAMN02982931_04738 [Bauldia litoralis]
MGILRTPPTIRPGEWVGASTPSLLSVAEAYARLTGRKADIVAEPASAMRDPGFAVLVMEPEQVTPEVLETLFSAPFLESRTFSPGLVLADKGPEGRARALQHAVALRFSAHSPAGRRVALFPLDELGFTRRDDGSVIAGGGCYGKISTALTRQANALVSILSHSDGIDMFLGPGQAACGWHSWTEISEIGARPRCLIRGICHRLDRPIDEPRFGDAIVDPSRWHARVLFLDICFGLPATGELFDRRFSIFDAILRGGRVGALVTNFELAFTGLAISEAVSEALASGEPIGKAIRNVTCSPSARRLNRRFALIGDPALTSKVGSPQLLPRPDYSVGPYSPVSPEIGALRFCLHVGGKPDLALQPGSSERDDAIIGWLCRRGKIFDLWTSLSQVFCSAEQFQCALCGRAGAVFRSSTNAPHLPRHLLLCVECGAVADSPATGGALMGRPEGDVFRLIAMPNERVRRAVLQLWAGDPRLSVACDWPISPEGLPHTVCQWRKAWPTGPLRANVFLLHGDEVSVASAMVPGRT